MSDGILEIPLESMSGGGRDHMNRTFFLFGIFGNCNHTKSGLLF